MNRKILSIIILAAIIIAGVCGYYAYGSYMDSKFDESFKTQYYYGDKYNESYIYANKLGNITNNNEKDFNENKKEFLKAYNDSIDYWVKIVDYRQKMVTFADTDIEKKYATLMLQISQKGLEQLKIWRSMYELNSFNSNSTNLNKQEELFKQIETLDKQITKIVEEKDKLKLSDEKFNQRIENLANQTETVTS